MKMSHRKSMKNLMKELDGGLMRLFSRADILLKNKMF
jgi:hypothetical protein